MTAAIDRMPNLLVNGNLETAFTTIIGCGAATGVYLVYRYSQNRQGRLYNAAGIAFCATAVNASFFGGWAISVLRQSFSWSANWLRVVVVVFGLAVAGAGFAFVTTYFIEAIRFMWFDTPRNR